MLNKFIHRDYFPDRITTLFQWSNVSKEPLTDRHRLHILINHAYTRCIIYTIDTLTLTVKKVFTIIP